MSGTPNLPFQTMYTEMDESFKVNNRWASGPSDEGAGNVFARMGSGANEFSRQQAETRAGGEQRRFVSEVSYASYGDKFKKMKFNQMETLKELRQEYEILRGLPLQDEFLGHSHLKKEASEYSSSRPPESVSSSSKQTDRRKGRRESAGKGSRAGGREAQVLSLEKRQLELVVGNSMRKIEELLSSEIEYKKIIHQLQLQLDSRTGDEKLENLARTMKKNEGELAERIEALKRDIERLKQTNMQLQNRNESLEAELNQRTQDLRKCRDQKRGLEDSVRLEKDKYMNLDIEVKRLKMEREIMEKDKNNEINRLKGLLESQPKDVVNSGEVRRLEDELRAGRQRYEVLQMEFERYKTEVSSRPKEIVQIKDDKGTAEQIRLFEALINHLKDEAANQSRASADLISSMVAKLDEKHQRDREREQERLERERRDREDRERAEREQRNKGKQVQPKANEDANRLLEELFHLRNEVSTLKEVRADPNRSVQIVNLADSMADYQSKIRKLEEEIADGSISKERLMKEYEIIKSSYEYAKEELDRMGSENQKLRERLSHTEQSGQMTHEQLRGSFREKETQYEETIRQLRRQLDEALFMVDKAKKEGEFTAGLSRAESESALKLAREQLARTEGEKALLRGELQKMRVYYEAKLQEKNALLEKTAQEFAIQCETKEKALAAYKANSEREMNELIRKLEGLAEVNERYMRQSVQLATVERELSELRYLVRRSKGINDGLDHLWQVKETEYYNVNDLLKQLHAQ